MLSLGHLQPGLLVAYLMFKNVRERSDCDAVSFNVFLHPAGGRLERYFHLPSWCSYLVQARVTCKFDEVSGGARCSQKESQQKRASLHVESETFWSPLDVE